MDGKDLRQGKIRINPLGRMKPHQSSDRAWLIVWSDIVWVRLPRSQNILRIEEAHKGMSLHGTRTDLML